MAELGDFGPAEHESLGRAVTEHGIDRLVTVGAEATGIHEGAQGVPGWAGESVHVPDIEAALRVVREGVRPGDVVLIKASHSQGLERLGPELLAENQVEAGGR
jgi:UDP-N-acetylmuramoyl-tripeptide--D-alanyl-D-alanine ligase